MAKTTTKKIATKPRAKDSGSGKSEKKSGKGKQSAAAQAGDAFLGLLSSPLVAELVAAAATAALASLAAGTHSKKGAGKAAKAAGAAAAAAIGQRLTTELKEIRAVSKAKKA